MTETTINLITCCFYCGGNQHITPLYIAKVDQVFSRDIAKEPCPVCKVVMSSGVAIFESTTTENPDAPMPAKGTWLTGRWTLVRPEFVPKIFPDEAAARIQDAGLAFITAEHFKRLGMADETETHH